MNNEIFYTSNCLNLLIEGWVLLSQGPLFEFPGIVWWILVFHVLVVSKDGKGLGKEYVIEVIVEGILGVDYLRTKDIQSSVVKQESCNRKILQSSKVKLLSLLQLSSCLCNHSWKYFLFFFSETICNLFLSSIDCPILKPFLCWLKFYTISYYM